MCTQKSRLVALIVVNISSIHLVCLPLQGDYDKAVQCFGRTCEIYSKLAETEALHSARVQFGIARGHQFMKSFSTFVNEESAEGIQCLLNWKMSREVSESENDQDDSNDAGSYKLHDVHDEQMGDHSSNKLH